MEPNAGILYLIKIYKNKDGRGSQGEWSNNYHIQTEDGLDSANVFQYANQIVNAEIGMHTNMVRFQRVTISTYAQEGDASTGEEVRVIPLGQVGQIVVNDGELDRLLPDESCVTISHGATLGRQGLNWYRHAIKETDWINTGKGPELNNNARELAVAGYTALLSGNFGGVPLVVVHKAKNGTVNARRITQFAYAGIRNRQIGARRRKKKAAV